MRLSAGDSRRFVTLFRDAMAECGLSSVYGLYLRADVPRATLHRWLNGRVRIPIAGAQELIDVLDQFSNHNAHLSALRDWLDAACAAASAEEQLHAELRARRVPVARTIDALRAAKLLPAEDVACHGTIEADRGGMGHILAVRNTPPLATTACHAERASTGLPKA